MRKIGIAIIALLGLILWAEGIPVFGQASPYNIQLFKAQTFTASGQTGAVLPLNGMTTGSTVASSYSLANITVSGTSLTAATFAVQGSADNGGTFVPLNINALATPGTVSTTVTVSSGSPAVYQFNPGGLTHVRVVTSGTFTGTALQIQIGLAPNSLIGRNGGGGGGSMVYPDVGIPVSTGTSWGASKTAPTGDLVGTTDTQTITNKTIDGATPAEVGRLSGVTSNIQTQLNSMCAMAGCTMTGPLTLNGDPTSNLQAATKQYVDSHSAGVSSFNTRTGAVTLAASDVNAVGAITNNTSGNAATATNSSHADNFNTQTNGSANPDTSYLDIKGGNGISVSVSGGHVTIATGPTFTIAGFSYTGTNPVEIGTNYNNPAFTASYGAVAAASPTTITNSDGISSPTSLSTPFTSGTVTGTFVKHSQASTTFTLNATGVNGGTATASVTINSLPRSMGGVGTSGATGCTASGNNCTLVGASGTLNDAGLVSTVVNNVFGPYSPTSGQNIYVLTPGSCTHTSWIDNVSGFVFLMNSGTSFSFTNQNGDSVSSCLYQSQNTYLSGSYAPKPTN